MNDEVLEIEPGTVPDTSPAKVVGDCLELVHRLSILVLRLGGVVDQVGASLQQLFDTLSKPSVRSGK